MECRDDSEDHRGSLIVPFLPKATWIHHCCRKGPINDRARLNLDPFYVSRRMNITLVCPCPKELYDHERGPWSPLPLHLIIMEHCLKTGDGNEKRMTRGVLLAFIY